MYTLVCIDSPASATQEGLVLQHALGALYPRLNEEGVLLYSVRRAGEPVLTLSVRYDEKGVYHCSHVVGLANRAPTPEELDEVRRLLGAHRIALRYDPAALS